MRRGRLSALCASLLIVVTASAGTLRQEQTPQIRFHDGGADERLATDATLAMRRLDHWLRPSPHDALTISRRPWFRAPADPAGANEVIVPSKMLAAARDRAAARAMIVELTKLYWPAAEENELSAGVRSYIATRVVHDQFSGTNYFTIGLLGGFVTHAVRAVPLTRHPYDNRPPVRHLPETRTTPGARRVVDAMFTLERYIGWPTVQYAIADWLANDPSAASRPLFEESLARASGRDLRWFTNSAFDVSTPYDYAAGELTSTPSPDGWVEVVVTAVRRGEGVFPLDVDVVFGDGTRVRERWDGAAPGTEWRYRSRSAAVAVVVDPDLVLLLDDDRRNNGMVADVPLHVPAVRWTLLWGAWLQNVLLTAAAII